MTNAPDSWPINDAASDNSQAKESCSEWVFEQMSAGRDADELLAELLSNGWSQDDAEGIVEENRRKTRSARSVTGARDQVAAESNRHYQRSMGATRSGFHGFNIFNIFAVFAGFFRLKPKAKGRHKSGE